MKRIERLSSFHDDHWIVIRDTADKLNEVIEAVNSLTERVEKLDTQYKYACNVISADKVFAANGKLIRRAENETIISRRITESNQ